MNDTTRASVMVVEDDPKIARLLVDYLVSEGLAATAFGDGLQGLRAFEASPPSALVLDLMLPGLDGLELCRAVRATSDVPNAVHADLRDVSDRAIDSHVKNLRRKVESVDPAFEGIVSVYGVGYRFDAPEPPGAAAGPATA